jgi:GMP synthase-like glutamine amidotransferase
VRVHWLQHAPFEGLGSIEEWLTARGAVLSATRFFQHQGLPRPHDVDWVIAMGGPMSVNDEARLPWLAAEKRFLREAIDAGRTVLGVCLGAQLIASALGAPVCAAEHREVGWFPVERVEGGETAPRILPERFTAFHWHGETFRVPRGALRLARSAGCENQAFAVGRRVLGIQFHLEVTPNSARTLCDKCPADLAPGPYVQPAQEIREAAEAFRAANRLMAGILDTLADASG